MFKKLGAIWPHLLRALAMSLAALAMAWGIAGTESLVAVMIGAAAGVWLGQALSASRLRLPVIAGGAALALLVLWLGAALATGTESVPRWLGAATTVRWAAVLRFGSVALLMATGLRAVAARKKTAVALELAFCTVAVATVFASHRDGVIARPLWLSDWAWQNGIDPTHVLLGVGCAAVTMLAVLLVVETRSGRGISSMVVLGILAFLALVCVSVVGVPKPDALADLGIDTKGDGEEPPPPPPDAGGSQQGDKQDGGGADPLDGGADGGGRGADALDGGQDGGSADGGGQEQANEKPSDSSQDQLENQDGQRGAAAPVAVVIFEDDYSPPAQAYYFREDALSQFNGSRLTAATRGDVDNDILLSHPTERTKVPYAPGANGRTKVRARVAMLTEHNRPFALEAPTEIAPMPNPNRQRFVRAYSFESLSQSAEYRSLLGKAPGDPAWKPDVFDYYTTPPSDPRYGELARSLIAKLPPVRQADPFAKALTIVMHLNKELSYSTKERHSGALDPTADMLFGNKIGYCVHFAHAAVFLWRSVGVPARVAVGYHVPVDARAGGSALLVKSGDAHAWPELYLAGIGWVVLDVAAERNLDPPAPPQDEDLQRLLGEMARSDPPDPKEPPQLRRPAARNWGRDIGLAGLLLVVGAAIALYLIKIWRRVTPLVAGQRSIGRVGYRYALDLLAEAGLSRDFGETREAFARRAGAMAPSFAALTNLHLASRWRGPEVPAADRPERSRAAWFKALRAVRDDLGRRGKLWRRLLGLVNPASIFDAR